MGKLFTIEFKRDGDFVDIVGNPAEGDFQQDMVIGDQVEFKTSLNGKVVINFSALDAKDIHGNPIDKNRLPFDAPAFEGVGGVHNVKQSCKALMQVTIFLNDGSGKVLGCKRGPAHV